MKPREAVAGFTLVEILVALFIVAMGMGALMAAISAAADTTAYLRDKSFAQWIALNRITEVRLQGSGVTAGKSKGDVEFAGQKWRWRQEVTDSGIASLMRIDVGVQSADQPAPADSADAFTDATGFAAGFVGRRVARANGQSPDWTGSPATPPAAPPGSPGAPPPTPAKPAE